MIDVHEAMEEVSRLNRDIERVLNLLGFECENVRYDQDDLDKEFLHRQLRSLADQLDDVKRKVSYLSNPIVEQGYITHNADGRYELPSGYYFTSGSICEILSISERFNEQYWLYTTIEHNGEDYYATALGRDKSINGMMVRIR